jgi:hypothetical protein
MVAKKMKSFFHVESDEKKTKKTLKINQKREEKIPKCVN